MSAECCPTCQRPYALVRVCKDCGGTFSIEPDEQQRFAGLGLQLPRRCGGCRAVRRSQNTTRPERATQERTVNQ